VVLQAVIRSPAYQHWGVCLLEITTQFRRPSSGVGGKYHPMSFRGKYEKGTIRKGRKRKSK
jgi:hypothetical protein